MTALPPDYDSDPERWRSWRPSYDIPDLVAPELSGPVLDVGCGDGRLAAALGPDVAWTGVDASEAQLAENPYRPVVRADMRRLPFRAGGFAEVTQLWCLYHVDDPLPAIREAARVLRPDGHYYACTSARDNDPELMPEGYPPTSLDAEDAAALVATAFEEVDVQRWDAAFAPLRTHDEVRAYCRHHAIPIERAEAAEVPLWLTKRGALIRARKPRPSGLHLDNRRGRT